MNRLSHLPLVKRYRYSPFQRRRIREDWAIYGGAFGVITGSITAISWLLTLPADSTFHDVFVIETIAVSLAVALGMAVGWLLGILFSNRKAR